MLFASWQVTIVRCSVEWNRHILFVRSVIYLIFHIFDLILKVSYPMLVISCCLCVKCWYEYCGTVQWLVPFFLNCTKDLRYVIQFSLLIRPIRIVSFGSILFLNCILLGFKTLLVLTFPSLEAWGLTENRNTKTLDYHWFTSSLGNFWIVNRNS